MALALLVWAVRAANGFGPLLHEPGRLSTFGEFFPVFVPSLTAMIGNWSTLSLYLVEGAYRYTGSWNWRAVLATAAGCALAWGGIVAPALEPLYDYGWFVGFFVAGLLYWALSGGGHTAAAVATRRYPPPTGQVGPG
jgi:cytosine/uracil/thiamine/allantoin permease